MGKSASFNKHMGLTLEDFYNEFRKFISQPDSQVMKIFSKKAKTTNRAKNWFVIFYDVTFSSGQRTYSPPRAQIHDAVVLGHITAIKSQLEKGVSIDLPVAKDEPQEGFTPLALAKTKFQYDAMVIFVEYGADIQKPLKSGEAEGHTAIFISEKKSIITKLLIMIFGIKTLVFTVIARIKFQIIPAKT